MLIKYNVIVPLYACVLYYLYCQWKHNALFLPIAKDYEAGQYGTFEFYKITDL